MILKKNPTSRWKAACVGAIFILGKVGQYLAVRPKVGPVKVKDRGVGRVRGDGVCLPKARLHKHGTNGISVIVSDPSPRPILSRARMRAILILCPVLPRKKSISRIW